MVNTRFTDRDIRADTTIAMLVHDQTQTTVTDNGRKLVRRELSVDNWFSYCWFWRLLVHMLMLLYILHQCWHSDALCTAVDCRRFFSKHSQ